MNSSKDFYIVKKGDTLEAIAARYGTTVEQLCKINGIRNKGEIAEGQIIALKAKAICKVTVLVLDRDHNPIEGAKIRLEYNGKSKILTSGACGILPSIITQTPNDIVKIYVLCSDGAWKHLKDVRSGWGNKRVTIISPKTKHEGETMPHPKDSSGRPVRDPKNDKKPVTPPENPEKTDKKSERKNDKNGLPVQKENVDQVKLDFLKGYTGEKITEADYKKAAKELGCEVEILMAIARQESKAKAYDAKKRPTILFERHWFSKLSNGKFDKSNPDVSSKKAYTSDKKYKSGQTIPGIDRYGAYGDNQYKRLAKAYKLDSEAALKSCSWGKFQIMGFNHKTCGYSSVRGLVAIMCESEKKQLDAVKLFIKRNCLKEVQNKNWSGIAFAYNGPKYKKNKYDTSLKKHYLNIMSERNKK